MLDDLADRYHDYLARFATELGDIAVGAFAKYNGKLIKKLAFEEFTPAYLEYTELVARYLESLDRGDTVNNVTLRLVREKSAEMLLKPPLGA